MTSKEIDRWIVLGGISGLDWLCDCSNYYCAELPLMLAVERLGSSCRDQSLYSGEDRNAFTAVVDSEGRSDWLLGRLLPPSALGS